MGVKWYCNRCNKQIWENISMSEKTTLKELLGNCICSDCQLEVIKKSDTSPSKQEDTEQKEDEISCVGCKWRKPYTGEQPKAPIKIKWQCECPDMGCHYEPEQPETKQGVDE